MHRVLSQSTIKMCRQQISFHAARRPTSQRLTGLGLCRKPESKKW
jgi:hypothetical protein